MNRGFVVAIVAVLVLAGSAWAGGEPDGSLRTWIDAEYLLWWFEPAPVSQPLVTTGPPSTLFRPGNGAFGLSNTSLLSGNGIMAGGPYSGYRLEGGWINTCDEFGFEGQFYYLAPHNISDTFSSNSSGSPLLARPIIDAATGANSVLFVSSPGNSTGSINVTSNTGLLNADANLLWPALRGCCDETEIIKFVHLLGGFRYLNFRENLSIAQSTAFLPSGIGFFDGLPVTSPGSLGIGDNFHALNQFYGGQIGFQAGLVWWRFAINATGKAAIGSMREEESISGVTTAYQFGTTQTTSGGLLAQSSNIGAHNRNMFAFIPEGNLTFSLEITPQIKLTLGWSVLWISNLARPGDMLDRTVNRTLVPSSQSFFPGVGGPARPGFTWNGTDFLATGLNVGLGLRF